jgi:hypothetical protein
VELVLPGPADQVHFSVDIHAVARRAADVERVAAAWGPRWFGRIAGKSSGPPTHPRAAARRDCGFDADRTLTDVVFRSVVHTVSCGDGKETGDINLSDLSVMALCSYYLFSRQFDQHRHRRVFDALTAFHDRSQFNPGRSD